MTTVDEAAHDATTTDDLPVLPAIVDGFVAHRRRGPIGHEFRHRVYQWLVDLDHLPRPPWYLRPVAGFDARDHLGGTGPDASGDIKRNVERFLLSVASTSAWAAGSSCSPTRGSSATCSTR